jgi:hypothetical protein
MAKKQALRNSQSGFSIRDKPLNVARIGIALLIWSIKEISIGNNWMNNNRTFVV